MIIGLGSDLCNIERSQNSLNRFGERFENRVFTEIERAKARRRQITTAATYAKRFAAKEACSKALGTGFRQGVYWRDMVVHNLPTGQPYMKLTGGALARLEKLTPDGMTAVVHVSQSDEYPMANAVVIIEARHSD